jgi:ABC-type Mn2+/Zn2+ transport system permease subunit
MNNEELARIIHIESRFINFLIVMTNVFMFIQLRNMTEKMNETNTGIFLSVFFSAAFTVVALVKKPLEVVDLRPSKNVDLK